MENSGEEFVEAPSTSAPTTIRLTENCKDDEAESTTENCDENDFADVTTSVPPDGEEEGTEDKSESEDSAFTDKTADEMLEEGKRLFRSREIEAAVEFLSRAVEKKHAELGSSDDFHPDLGLYYLWYGDALLTKEEQNDEMFQLQTNFSSRADAPKIASTEATCASPTPSIIPKAHIDGASDTRASIQMKDVGTTQCDGAPSDDQMQGQGQPPPNNTPPDEELAFQMLEMARKCIHRKTDAAFGTEGTGVGRNDAMDLSFAYVRLADMQLMNNKFEEAMNDYQAAVDLRKKFGLPEQTFLAPNLSLAQATFFSGDKDKALALFTDVLAMGEKILSEKLQLPDGTTMKAISDMTEDLKIQINDITRQITEDRMRAASGIRAGANKGSQSEAKDLVVKTTSSFDKPQFDATVPIKRVAIRPAGSNSVEATLDEAHSLKKRRIDLKQVNTVESASSEALEVQNSAT